MHFDTVLLDAHGRRERDRPHWPDLTMDDWLRQSLANSPDKVAVVGYRVDRTEPERISYRQLDAVVDALGRALLDLGLARHDVVSVQLPNWWQALAITLACTRVGLVTNPLMPIFRERELVYMLGLNEAKAIFIPETFRDFDYPAMLAGIRGELPALAHVIAVNGTGPSTFDGLLARGAQLQSEGVPYAPQPLHPDDVQCIKYTSGTTGNPKGVMHTSNTLIAGMECLRERLGVDAQTVALAGSPVGHMSGYLMLSLLPVRLGATTVMVDVWEPRRAMDVTLAEGVTYTVGSTPFLADMITLVEDGATPPTTLKSFLCAGAPIPPVLIEKAQALMSLPVTSSYGSTEAPGATLTEPERAYKSATSDGRATRGWEVKVVGDDNLPRPTGEPGRIQVRGSSLFAGYLKHPELNDVDEQGWFETGDIGYQDDEGYLRISGRSKDIIIRGGENIPVAEVEDLLLRHPVIVAAAVVGYPDERLGERGVAFVVTTPGETFTLAQLQAHLEAAHMARPYWPERVEVIEEMPYTPTGKVQKFKLKEIALGF